MVYCDMVPMLVIEVLTLRQKLIINVIVCLTHSFVFLVLNRHVARYFFVTEHSANCKKGGVKHVTRWYYRRLAPRNAAFVPNGKEKRSKVANS